MNEVKPIPSDPKSADEIRVLVVDDSALVRQTVAGLLRELPGVRVVGKAADGREAIEMIEKVSPDLITLDVEMPNMNGIETLREMTRRKLPAKAIMLSSLTRSGAGVTLEALFQGAFDFITKPTGNLLVSREALRA